MTTRQPGRPFSDAMLDFALAHDPRARVACETMVLRDRVVVAADAAVAGMSLDELNAAVPALTRRVTVQLAYGIGDPRPVVQLTTHGTGRVPDARLREAAGVSAASPAPATGTPTGR